MALKFDAIAACQRVFEVILVDNTPRQVGVHEYSIQQEFLERPRWRP